MRSHFFAIVFLILSSSASAAPMSCPDRYLVSTARVVDTEETPKGWTGFVQANLSLLGAGVLMGAPEKNGEIVPETRQRGGGLFEVVYRNLDADPTLDKWVSCAYGDSTAVGLTLVRRLPQDVKHCVARYLRQSGKRPSRFLGIDCE